MVTESWQFWAIMAAVFAALTAIFAKVGVDEVNPNLATLLRTLVVMVSLFAIVWLLGDFEPLSRLSSKGVAFLVLSGLGTGASWLCYFRALKLGQASQVAPLDKLSVVFVAVIGVAFLGEALSVTAWLGIVFIAAGAGLVALA